jgi:hypothetical protein
VIPPAVNLHNDEGFGRNEHIGQGAILRLLVPSGTPVPKNTSTIAEFQGDGRRLRRAAQLLGRGNYNPAQRIIQEVEAEIQRLQAARALLAGDTNARKVGKPGKPKKSAVTKAKMAEAQRARWAKRGSDSRRSVLQVAGRPRNNSTMTTIHV